MSDVTVPTGEEKTESTQQELKEAKRMKSRIVRRHQHPLEVNDELAYKTIKTVRLDFLTEEAKAPIPRCQALPAHAFSRLTGRSILVALSHGWFFQTHPDPFGEKLDLIRNVFAPKLRER